MQIGSGKTYNERVAECRNKIVDMVHQIKNEKYLKMIYGYVNSAYREEKSRD